MNKWGRTIFGFIIFHFISIFTFSQVSISDNNAGPDNSAVLSLSSTTRGFRPPSMTKSQRLSINSPSAGLLVYQYNDTMGLYYYNGANWLKITETESHGEHYIGEMYGGGIVFYVFDEGRHGLVASTTDQSLAATWINSIYTETNARDWGIYAGMINTERIVINQGIGNYAALICADYQDPFIGLADWYLPSFTELQQLYIQKSIAGCTLNYYWSSSEIDLIDAWYFNFENGTVGNGNKGGTFPVRCIRKF